MTMAQCLCQLGLVGKVCMQVFSLWVVMTLDIVTLRMTLDIVTLRMEIIRDVGGHMSACP